jgi:hypothetical protein
MGLGMDMDTDMGIGPVEVEGLESSESSCLFWKRGAERRVSGEMQVHFAHLGK